MLFNFLEFAIFLPIVFLLYWFATGKDPNLQNFVILFASYVFYGWWDWRFLSLIVISTLIDYSVGVSLGNSESKKHEVLMLFLIFLNLHL